MNILFVAPRYHTNQIPIITGLINHGYNVRFLSYYNGITEDYDVLVPDLMKASALSRLISKYIDKSYDDCSAEMKKVNWFLPPIMHVIHYIKDFKPDLVILRERSKASAIVNLCCRLLHIKNIVIYNQIPLEKDVPFSFISRCKRKIFFPQVRYTPVLYTNLISNIGVRIHAEKHSYFVPFVYHVNPLVQCKRQYPTGKSKVKILDVGKFREYKNHFLLIDAIRHISDRNDFNVVIIGQVSNKNEVEYYSNLEKYITKNDLNGCIEIRKNIPYNQMDNLYREFDVLVLPSKRECAGMVVLESMAHGLCTVSTDHNGTACYVIEGKAGYVFDHTDSMSLADVLRNLLEHKELISMYGQNGYKYIADHCQFDNYLEHLRIMMRCEFNYHM